MKAYAEDLAYVHDVGYGGHARRCAVGLLEIMRRRGVHQGRVVDLGCGSGIWAKELDDAGYQVVGVDLSPEMIKLARRRVPKAEFHAQTFLDFEIPACHVVTSIGEPLNYLFDERNRLAQLKKLFKRVFSALDPGGLFMFDVGEPGRHRGTAQSHRMGDDWACLVDYQHEKGDRLTRHIVTFRQVGKTYRRGQETHLQQLYRGSDLAALLRTIGFRVQIVRGYGEFRFPEKVVGLVARKP